MADSPFEEIAKFQLDLTDEQVGEPASIQKPHFYQFLALETVGILFSHQGCDDFLLTDHAGALENASEALAGFKRIGKHLDQAAVPEEKLSMRRFVRRNFLICRFPFQCRDRQ